MKNSALNILKYLISFIIIVFIEFLIILLFNISNVVKIPATEVNYHEFLRGIISPVFFHAVYNSLFVSIFLFPICFFRKISSFRVLNFFIPVIFSVIVVSCVNIFLYKTSNDIKVTSLPDARIYFTENSFMTYYYSIPDSFSDTEFEQDIMERISDIKVKKLFDKSFAHDIMAHKYFLLKNINKADYLRLRDTLYSIGYYEDIKYYFEGIKKDKIDHAIIVRDGKSVFSNSVAVVFESDYVIVRCYDIDLELKFAKDMMLENESFKTHLLENIIKNMKSFAFNFFIYDNIIMRIALWCAFAFFAISLLSISIFKDYPFMSFVINSCVFILIYMFTTNFIEFYNNTISIFSNNIIINCAVLCTILVLVGCIFMFANMFIIKSGIWSKE